MSHNHVALIVEDDPAIVESLRSIVLSLGHTPLIVNTRDAALTEIEKRSFCYVFLDMDLPESPSAKPSVITGLTLLKNDLRRAFPGRTPSDKHRTQIIALTANPRDPDFVTRVMQEGANDCLTKPFDDEATKVADKVNGCLRHSERRDHARCNEATKAATRANVAPPPSTRAPAPKVEIHITARVRRSRYDLRVGDRAMTCTEGSLHKLLTFAAARAGGAVGWIHRSELGREGAVHKSLSRLRGDFKQLLSEHGIDDILNNDNGKYRLDERIVISIDEAMTQHESSARIRSLSMAVRSGVAPLRAKKLTR